MSLYVESQQWRSALETNANNLGYEIIVVTHMELYHRRGRGGGRGMRKRRKRRRRIFKTPLNNNLKVKVVGVKAV